MFLKWKRIDTHQTCMFTGELKQRRRKKKNSTVTGHYIATIFQYTFDSKRVETLCYSNFKVDMFCFFICIYIFGCKEIWFLLHSQYAVMNFKLTNNFSLGSQLGNCPKQRLEKLVIMSSVLTKHAVMISHKLHCCSIRDLICEWLNDEVCSCFVMLFSHH